MELFIIIVSFCIAIFSIWVIVMGMKEHGSFGNWVKAAEEQKAKEGDIHKKNLSNWNRQASGVGEVNTLIGMGHSLNRRIEATNSVAQYTTLYAELLELCDELIKYEHLDFIDWGGSSPRKNKEFVMSKKEEQDKNFIDRSYLHTINRIEQLGEERSKEVIRDYFTALETMDLSTDNRRYSASLKMDANKILEGKKPKHFDVMDGHEFERFCAELLVKNGFKAEVTKRSGDFGVDVFAEKDGITYAIQCKRQSSKVSNKAVQEIYSGRDLYKKHIGAIMTNQYFTKSAHQTADRTGIILWDRDHLERLIAEK